MTEPPTPTGGIPVPSWLIPVIGAIGTFVAGALVADDLSVYWRPALVPVIGAVVAVFVARPVARQRLKAAHRQGEAEGAEFGVAATYAQALEAKPAARPTTKKKAPAASKGTR